MSVQVQNTAFGRLPHPRIRRRSRRCCNGRNSCKSCTQCSKQNLRSDRSNRSLDQYRPACR